jgi:hypothetical protein
MAFHSGFIKCRIASRNSQPERPSDFKGKRDRVCCANGLKVECPIAHPRHRGRKDGFRLARRGADSGHRKPKRRSGRTIRDAPGRDAGSEHGLARCPAAIRVLEDVLEAADDWQMRLSVRAAGKESKIGRRDERSARDKSGRRGLPRFGSCEIWNCGRWDDDANDATCVEFNSVYMYPLFTSAYSRRRAVLTVQCIDQLRPD